VTAEAQGKGGDVGGKERRSWLRPQEGLGADRGGAGGPGFLKQPKNISGRVKLLARLAAIAFGTLEIAGIDALGRIREQRGGYAPARGGQAERDLGVKFGLGGGLKFNLRILAGRPIFGTVDALQA